VKRIAFLVLCAALAGGPARAQDIKPPLTVDPAQPQSQTQSQGSTMQGGAATAGIEETDASVYERLVNRTVQFPGAVDAKVYRVGPGDALLLQLWGRVSRSIPIEVGPEGTVLIPGAGPIKVDGRTLAEVKEELLNRLRGQFRGVNMDLRLARARVFRVYLTGQVRSPGPTEGTGTSRVGDVLMQSALLEDASRRRIEVLHRDGTRDVADLELFLRTGDNTLNPWLRDGDVINVPVATEFVWAQGALARPGRFEVGPRDSLRTILRLAGDPVPSAEASRVLLIRWRDPFTSESTWVSLDDIYARRANYPMVDGERLYVYYVPQYHLQHEAMILGEVHRPGSYPIEEGRTHLSYLVAAADQFLPSADLSAIRVHRRNPNVAEKDPELDRLLRLSRNELTVSEYEKLRTKLAAMREDYRVDWTRLQADRDNLDLLLRDGDIVRVERLVNSIRVDGEVRRPGILAYTPGRRVEDYLRQTGGFTDRAWRGKVRVTRAVTGQTLLARNVRTLDPGDFIWVPEKPDVTVWQQVREVLTALATVATIVIAIRSVR
jgi:protein involved in polysaccharide export with SLBB domain